MNQNSNLYQQINILTQPPNASKTHGSQQATMKIDLSNNKAGAAPVGLGGSLMQG